MKQLYRSSASAPVPPRRHAGFTAIELMTVLAIAAIMMGIAGPAFQSMGNRSRSQAYASALVRDIQLARSTAVQTGMPVTLCAAASASTCAATASSWLAGWVIYEGITFNATTSTLVANASADNNTSSDTFSSSLSSGAPALTFNRQGFSPAAGAGVMFTFVAGTGSNASKNCVVVTAVGIPTQYSAGATTPAGTC